jgi:amidase
MTRTVSDAAVLLGVMANKEKYIDYTQYLDKNGLKGARIGISRMFLENADKDYLEIMESIISVMRKHGADCVELPPHDLTSGDKFGSIMKYEFKCGINNYLESMKNSNIPKNLQEIILYNQTRAHEALKYGQIKLIDAQNNASGTLTEPDYINVILEREKIIKGFDSIFTDNKVDVIFCMAGTGLPALTGFPSMTIPVGTGKDNLPIGSFWTTRRFDEKSLLRVTYGLEKILNARRNPL